MAKRCGNKTQRYPPKVGECLTKSAIQKLKASTRRKPKPKSVRLEPLGLGGGKGIRDSDNTYYGTFRPMIANGKTKMTGTDMYNDIVRKQGDDYATNVMFDAAATIQNKMIDSILTRYGIEAQPVFSHNDPSIGVDWETLEFEFKHFPRKISLPAGKISLPDGYIVTGWKYGGK